VEHASAGLPPLLHFDYEMVVDGRKLGRPVNYALVRIVPPEGVDVDPTRRPYVIIDPRAGHGPGIGGFKDDSQVGVALRDGHPVYFVIFFRDPEPGQTLLDVCEAEKQFVHKVRELHPHSAKPAIVGNCQGGWAAMMLAAADPDDTGPIVINGAPMSYWGGAWQEGEGDNPMRYAGGMLGGTWLASFVSDLGDGVFDGAYLVENFENLHPANTFWDKYYHLYANIDTEPPRFLEFERWWGGFYLMNREEIEWITRNLFVGNKLWKGETRASDGAMFDLRNIKAPIILFASMGDNITPPQQAFNWVADVYGSTDEIKSRGQVIVGLMHESVGHLGIFVSGKVAKKEHRQIVSVLKSIETLRPGLYAMSIRELETDGEEVSYEVEFSERQLEDVVARLNRFDRADEKPFEAVATISEFNQRAYELFAQPLVQATSSESAAKMRRQFHPLRVQRWALSDLNPWLGWLGPTAKAVKAQRRSAAKDNAALKIEKAAFARDQRVAGLLSIGARCGERGCFLSDLRQRFLALCHRRSQSGERDYESDRRAPRAAVREGGPGIDRRGRICRGALARRMPARAEGRAPAAVATAAEAGADVRLRRSAARDACGPVAPRTGRAGDHRSL
jgi:pimeloyl-ACP methyl ester carboxylesterase